jgi:hypothetical protein
VEAEASERPLSWLDRRDAAHGDQLSRGDEAYRNVAHAGYPRLRRRARGVTHELPLPCRVRPRTGIRPGHQSGDGVRCHFAGERREVSLPKCVRRGPRAESRERNPRADPRHRDSERRDCEMRTGRPIRGGVRRIHRRDARSTPASLHERRRASRVRRALRSSTFAPLSRAVQLATKMRHCARLPSPTTSMVMWS